MNSSVRNSGFVKRKINHGYCFQQDHLISVLGTFSDFLTISPLPLHIDSKMQWNKKKKNREG